MPTRWHHLLKHPNVNRVVAKLIERDGSPADTPLPTVNRRFIARQPHYPPTVVSIARRTQRTTLTCIAITDSLLWFGARTDPPEDLGVEVGSHR